jgi:hypothetical protein
MSLIPSESYSFPDHFTSTVTPSRKQKEEGKEKVKAPPTKPKIVALPDLPAGPSSMLMEQESQFFAEDQPMKQVQSVVESMQPKPTRRIEPFRPRVAPTPSVAPVSARPLPPNPAMLRATAPPAKIPDPPIRKMPFPSSLKPKVRWNNRAPAMEPAPVRQESIESAPVAPPPNIIPMQPKPATAPPARPMQPAPRPAPTARPAQQAPAIREPFRPAAPPAKAAPSAPEKRPVQAKPIVQKRPVAPNQQADLFEMFAESGQEAAMRRRRQMKFRRFIACEVAALVVLVPLVILGLTRSITSPALHWLMNLFTIAAAISAAVIPIVFYAFTPTLPELER